MARPPRRRYAAVTARICPTVAPVASASHITGVPEPITAKACAAWVAAAVPLIQWYAANGTPSRPAWARKPAYEASVKVPPSVALATSSAAPARDSPAWKPETSG